jgi:di/tricarboxylate transporter
VATAALPALAYLWLVAPRLLAHVQPPAEEVSEQVFDAELQVESASWLEGRELREAFAATGGRMRLVDVRRDDRSPARLPSLVLRAGDRLLLQDTTRGLKDIEASLHATLHGLHSDPGERGADGAPVDADAATAPVSVMVVQMIVTPGSPLVGRSVRQQRLAERYDTAVVGLRPREVHEGWQRENLADRAVHAGDILLLQGDEKSIRLVQRDGFGLLLDARYAVPRQSKSALALATMAAVVLLAATQTLPIALAALAGVLFLIATRCLSWQDVTQSLSAKVVLLVAASLALGQALEITHATAWLGQQLAVLASGLRPAWVLVLLMGLMGLLTNFVSNNAAAAIGTPLGVALARSLGVAPEPFVLAVLFGCNLSYLTPMGYQTNLLVMNAGGYRFSDFLRVGTPLFLIMWAGLSYGLMLRYGL